MGKCMMNNRFGFREIIAQFDAAAIIEYKQNKDDEDNKSRKKKNQSGLQKKPQPPVLF